MFRNPRLIVRLERTCGCSYSVASWFVELRSLFEFSGRISVAENRFTPVECVKGRR